MILDELATFIRNAPVNTGAAGAYLVGKTWDTIKNKDLANVSGKVKIRVTQDLTSGGAATLAYELITSNAADMSAPVVLWQSGAVPIANLKAGALHSSFSFPAQGQLRYLRLRQVTGTAAFTGGKVDASYVHNGRNYNVPTVAPF